MSFFTWFQDLSRLESASMVTILFLLLRILGGEACWLLDFAVLEAEVVVAMVTGVPVQCSPVAGAAGRLRVTGARN